MHLKPKLKRVGNKVAHPTLARAGKKAVINDNKIRNDGITKCENCGVQTVPAQQSKKGVTPPQNETQVDHKIARAKNGSGTPNNGQVLCRGCNRAKGAK